MSYFDSQDIEEIKRDVVKLRILQCRTVQAIAALHVDLRLNRYLLKAILVNQGTEPARIEDELDRLFAAEIEKAKAEVCAAFRDAELSATDDPEYWDRA